MPVTSQVTADCAADSSIKDLVGFGTAAVRETLPATGADNTHSVSRDAVFTDTDNNSVDLFGSTPSPRNSAGTGGDGGGDPSPTPAPTDTTPGDVRIHDIQGATRLSPYAAKPPARTDLINKLPVGERYSYVCDGNSQTLDHILVTPGIHDPGYELVHVNAEFSDRTSDHDPQVVRIK
nr:hypothetical protein [Streptomyces atratus]